MTSERNDVIVKAWNTVLFDKFLRFKHLLSTGSPRTAARRSRVPDTRKACACSTSVRLRRQHAAHRAPRRRSGRASASIARRASSRPRAPTRAEAVANAEFFVADVQADDLRGPYDARSRRFGTMFFNLPARACATSGRRSCRRRALHDRLAPPRGESLAPRRRALRARAGAGREHEDTDQVHCGPGRSRCRARPREHDAAQRGIRRISFERFDADICIGRDLDEAIEFAMALGPAGEIMRLRGEEAEKRKPQVIAALRETLSRYEKPNGVWGPSSTWFVRARNPAPLLVAPRIPQAHATPARRSFACRPHVRSNAA
jgi:hypothetical protein